MRARSVLSFLVRLGLVASFVFESSSSVWGDGRSRVPFSILVSCFMFVYRSGCPTLPSVSIYSGFCGGGHLLPLSYCCPLFRLGYLVGPPYLLSCPLDCHLFVCRPRCFSKSEHPLSMKIFVVPCIMLNSEINPTICNNCVYSSQWLYSTCFG